MGERNDKLILFGDSLRASLKGEGGGRFGGLERSGTVFCCTFLGDSGWTSVVSGSFGGSGVSGFFAVVYFVEVGRLIGLALSPLGLLTASSSVVSAERFIPARGGIRFSLSTTSSAKVTFFLIRVMPLDGFTNPPRINLTAGTAAGAGEGGFGAASVFGASEASVFFGLPLGRLGGWTAEVAAGFDLSAASPSVCGCVSSAAFFGRPLVFFTASATPVFSSNTACLFAADLVDLGAEVVIFTAFAGGFDIVASSNFSLALAFPRAVLVARDAVVAVLMARVGGFTIFASPILSSGTVLFAALVARGAAGVVLEVLLGGFAIAAASSF